MPEKISLSPEAMRGAASQMTSTVSALSDHTNQTYQQAQLTADAVPNGDISAQLNAVLKEWQTILVNEIAVWEQLASRLGGGADTATMTDTHLAANAHAEANAVRGHAPHGEHPGSFEPGADTHHQGH